MSVERVRPICLFGAGGHGRVVRDQLRRFLQLEVLFGDERAAVPGVAIAFHEITGITGCCVAVTVGNNLVRRKLQEQVGLEQIAAPLVIDPSRIFAAAIGHGSQILAGAIVNSEAILGKGVILNSGAIVEHDCRVGDYCHLAPGSVVGGGAVLGSGVMLGSNATILPGIKVATDAVIGAGAVVTADIHEAGTYVGIPARALPKSQP